MAVSMSGGSSKLGTKGGTAGDTERGSLDGTVVMGGTDLAVGELPPPPMIVEKDGRGVFW